ncbi:MAG: GNAT family N-acetyltransferase [Clostridia bacterium]|nr:GNAT family N-acetyltransferase [Clostridia bacterium]
MTFELARRGDIGDVMRIVGDAQAYLRECGVDQWQDGYPPRARLEADIAGDRLYVLREDGAVAGFCALYIGDEEPTYRVIRGSGWSCERRYTTVHRMALARGFRGRGAAGLMLAEAERMSAQRAVTYMRADTHRDNAAMQRALERAGYSRRGVIWVESGAERIAFDKLLQGVFCRAVN